jgi:hypothetical protein
MSKPKPLTRRQRVVLDDLFTSEMKEQEVLDKHDVSRSLYHRWLADERFNAEFERRIAQAYQAGRVALARYAPEAASKLIELTACEGKPDIARRACLDIIATQNPATTAPSAVASPPAASEPPTTPLTPETASRILALLAGERNACGCGEH